MFVSLVQHGNKPTKHVCGFIWDDDLNRLNTRCHAVGGLCSKSGKPHFHLTGTGPGGICWTRIAQPYPHGLARALSHCLLSDARQKFMNKKQWSFVCFWLLYWSSLFTFNKLYAGRCRRLQHGCKLKLFSNVAAGQYVTSCKEHIMTRGISG